MQRVKQVQGKRKESEIRKRSVFFTDGQKWLSFCCLLQSFVFVYRAQKREFTLKLFTDWFGSYFIAALMYSQFMFTISRKIYRLLQPTYLATSFQGWLNLVSSLKFGKLLSRNTGNFLSLPESFSSEIADNVGAILFWTVPCWQGTDGTCILRLAFAFAFTFPRLTRVNPCICIAHVVDKWCTPHQLCHRLYGQNLTE